MSSVHPRILLVDDETKLLAALKKSLEMEGYEVATCADPQTALAQIIEAPPALVISDIRMPGLSGLDLLARIDEKCPGVPVVLMTAYSSVESAVQAVRLGARDYLLKPFHLADLKATVARLLAPPPPDGAAESGVDLIGVSPAMVRVRELIAQVAPTDGTVLIQGESGTGKELVARALHLGSPRAERPFVPVNCSTLPDTLFESELFGHARGSFTGAIGDREGLFESADGGTLFLDEIGDLSPAGQVKLLRVLQDGQYKRVGETRSRTGNVRVLAASNKDLRAETGAKRFREDLYYRLNVITIHLPPLRERPEDLAPLVGYLLARFTRRYRKPGLKLDPTVLPRLQQHRWPGNVRELENVLERAVILARGPSISGADLAIDPPRPLEGDRSTDQTHSLIADDGPTSGAAAGSSGTVRRAEGDRGPADERSDAPGSVRAGAAPPEGSLPPGCGLADAVDGYERQLIERALVRSGGNYSRAAALLGVTRQNLHYKIRKYGLEQGEREKS